jgi:hypothetical protein
MSIIMAKVSNSQSIPAHYPQKQNKCRKGYIPQNDAEILAQIRRQSIRLDSRFSWIKIVTLFLELGSIVNGLVTINLINKCNKIQDGLPLEIEAEMWYQVLKGLLPGLVPVVGSLFQMMRKPNINVCDTLERYLSYWKSTVLGDSDSGILDIVGSLI